MCTTKTEKVLGALNGEKKGQQARSKLQQWCHIPEHCFSQLQGQSASPVSLKDRRRGNNLRTLHFIRVPRLEDEMNKRRRKQGWEAEAGEMETKRLCLEEIKSLELAMSSGDEKQQP